MLLPNYETPEKKSTKQKMHGISIVSALAAAYVRQVLQYGEYIWSSFSHFFGSWVLHYFVLLIVIGVFYMFSQTTHEFFFGSNNSERKLSVEEAVIYCSLFLLILSVFTFFIAHLEVDEYDFHHGY